MKPVDPELVGELWPSARPFDDPSQYGHIEFNPTGAFEVRSLQTFKLVYTVGPYGIDDTGALKVVFRFPMDIGGFQTSDPTALNYVTARASNGATLSIRYNPSGHMRPRDKTLTVYISDGFMSQGDTITIIFGTYGGLTCFLTSELSRESIFDCMRRRHHYETSGNRLHLDVRARFKNSADFYEFDPKVYKVTPQPRTEIMMGDIAQTDDQTVDLFIHAMTQTPIERIEVFNADEFVHTMRGYGSEDLGNRIRVVWSGAKYRGRGRQSRWFGKLAVEGARITGLKNINVWNQEQLLEQRGDSEIIWDIFTTGNFSSSDKQNQ